METTIVEGFRVEGLGLRSWKRKWKLRGFTREIMEKNMDTKFMQNEMEIVVYSN